MSIMRAQLPRELHAYGDMVGNRQSLDAGAPSITYEGNQQAGGIYNQGSDRANAMMMWNNMSSGDKSIYDFNFEMFLDSGDWMDSILGQITGGQEDMIVQIKEAYKQHKAQGGQESFEEFIQIIGEQGQGRQQAAYGGIMGADGRRQYGIGSWFQEKIMDPIKGTVKKVTDNPLATAAALYGGYSLGGGKYGLPGVSDKTGFKFGNILPRTKDLIFGTSTKYENPETGKIETQKNPGWLSGLGSALLKPEFLIPAAGVISGAFAKEDDPGYTGQGTGLNLRDIGKLANISDEKVGQATGLRFLPEVSARKYTPEEMIATYAATEPANFETPAEAAQGGRIGYSIGGREGLMELGGREGRMGPGAMLRDMLAQATPGSGTITQEQDAMIRDMLNKGMDSDTISTLTGVTPEQLQMIINQITVTEGANEAQKGLEESGALEEIINLNKAKGGRIGAQDGGLMSLGGMEMDLRGGGFVPIGEREKADDVPARLSKNEFVFTADAVRAAGGGDVDAGADKMYKTMKDLEGMVA